MEKHMRRKRKNAKRLLKKNEDDEDRRNVDDVEPASVPAVTIRIF
jgi:hypothetical protein